jgi:hypothetical protein
MKRLVVFSMLVAGASLALSAQTGGRPQVPSYLACLCEDSQPVLAEQVGPLCNPPYIPQEKRAWIDPAVYNLRDPKPAGQQEYRPYNPGQSLRNISAPMPKTRER